MFVPRGPLGTNSCMTKFRGSFLVLNLEANAVGVENAGEFRPIPLKVNANTSIGNAVAEYDNHPNLNRVSMENSADLVIESSRNGDASTKKNSSKVLLTRDVEKRERERRMEPRKRAKKKTNSVRNSGLNHKAQDREVPPEEMMCSNKLENSEIISRWSPPQYLINLLGFFGWKVELHRGSVGFVYVSPQGITYSSLPKIFEIFLHGNWKSDLSQHFTSSKSVIDGLVVQERGGPRKGNTRMKNGYKEKNVDVAEPSKSLVPRGVGRCTRSIAKKIASEENSKDKLGFRVGTENMTKEAPKDKVEFFIATERRINHTGDGAEEIYEDVNSSIPFSRKSHQIRRSSRLNQKHVSNKSQQVLEINTSYSDSLILEEDENAVTTSSSDSEFDLSDASDMSSEASITSSDDEYKMPTTSNKSKLSKLRKSSILTIGSRKRGKMAGDNFFCSIRKDQIHPNSSTFGTVCEGDSLVLTKQTSTDEKINDREDVVVSAPILNKEVDKTASLSGAFSDLKAKDFSSSGIISRLTYGINRSSVQKYENNPMNCNIETEATVQGDSDQNEKGALVEDRSAELQVTFNETLFGRKPKKQNLFRTRRWKNDARNELPNSTSSKVECAIEDPNPGKNSQPKKRKLASCSNVKGRKNRRRSGMWPCG